jgi:hypothetical protein
MTRALLVASGTPEEIAAWEAAGRPEFTAAEFDAALDWIYAGD